MFPLKIFYPGGIQIWAPRFSVFYIVDEMFEKLDLDRIT
jgi:hypothetical protein